MPRAIRFPVELIPPEGFNPEDPRTWPTVDGRIEYVNGRLLFMPPCGDLQQDTVADVVITLGNWVRQHSGFVVGTNEAELKASRTFPNGKATRVECCGTLKKDALKAVLDAHHFTGVIVGIRRDDDRILAAHLGDHALDPLLAGLVACGALVDPEPDLLGAREADEACLGMLDEAVADGGAGTRDVVQDPRWNTGLEK